MTLVVRTFCLLHAVFVGAVFAEEPPLLREARRALAESIPHVAIAKIERLFASGNLPVAEESAARLLLGEAFLQARRFEDAHAAIAPLAGRDHPAARLLQADIFAAAGEWARALPLYHAINSEPEPPVSALLGEAESLHALGQTGAIAKLEAAIAAAPQLVAARLRLASLLVETGNDKGARRTLAGVHPTERGEMKWKEYVEARQLLLADQPAPALVMFEEIVKEPRGLSEGLLVGATFGIAEARSSMHGSDAADSVLESFIWKNPGSPYLELVFRRLDQIYATQENPSESELQKWTKNAPPRCAALAWYYLAHFQVARRQPEKAAQTLQEFITRNATHPLVPHAHLMEADLFIAKGRLAEAIAALEAAARRSTNENLRAEIELRTGIAHFHANEFLLAGNFFDLAARRSRKLRELALYNSALAALRLNNLDRFFEQYRELRSTYPGSELPAELELEQGLVQARNGDARAGETLELFLHHFPQHARSSEARIALAELAFAGRDLPVAAQYLQIASTAGRPANTADQADYLALFLADAETPRDEQKIINLAKEFIRDRPQSSLLPEVRLKLGQVYFRNNDFPNAETQLVVLARDHPQSAYAEPALFLAGQAAMKTGAIERALELFDQVAARNGPLKLRAREQQAIIASGQGKAREAIALYEIILAAQPPPESELRYAALCGKADNLIAIATKEPGQIDPALAIYDALAASDAGLLWRNQALYKKGKALEQRGLKGEALSAYYDVLNQSEGNEREYFWFYKAGFDAARIFESQEQWQSALGIYKKMARQKGPRAAEVNERVRELRLARFLWD